MAKDQFLIETGVDRLVKLVKESKKIPFAEAAKKLGIPLSVIAEWANFLEEEGVVIINYVFTTPYLEIKSMQPSEVQKKENEVAAKRMQVEKKVEQTLGNLEENTQFVASLRKELEKLSGEISSEIGELKTRIAEAKSIDEKKTMAEIDAIQKKKEFQDIMGSMNRQLEIETKKYQQLLSEINLGRQKVRKEKIMATSIEEQETSLQKKLDGLNSMILRLEKNGLKKKLPSGKPSLAGMAAKTMSSSDLKNMKEFADNIRQEIEQRKANLAKITDDIKDYELRIKSMQAEMVGYIKKQKKIASHNKMKRAEVIKKAEQFLQNKKKTEILLKKAETDVIYLQAEMENLVKKATALHEASKSKNLELQVKELKQMLAKIAKKHMAFKKEVDLLGRTVEKFAVNIS